MPPVLFRERTIMEIGPGGGFNALAYFHWGSDVVFVEPNHKGQEEIPIQMAENGILPNRWTLIKNTVENIPANKQFDIVIAEGFLPGLHDRDPVVSALSKLTSKGGVLVVTCADDVSILFEVVRRIIATRLIIIQGAVNFQDKVDLLSQAFASHLAKLQYASRPVNDWVTDVFINPACYANLFSIEDCINEFGNEFEIMASSPDMFTDYSWYKNTEFNRNGSCLAQFACKRHNLILWDIPETIRSAEANATLHRAAYALRRYASGMAEDLNNEPQISVICEILKSIINITTDLDARIGAALSEAAQLISDSSLNAKMISTAEKLAVVFGRGQQYVSLVRNTGL